VALGHGNQLAHRREPREHLHPLLALLLHGHELPW
jgi:hypothetical protein